MSEFKTTREKILATAGECPESKRALKNLFPEAFIEEVNINFKLGDQLAQKGSNKIYLIAADEDKFLRIVSITSGHLWVDKKVQVPDSRVITSQQVREAFGLRNLKNYTLVRGKEIINL